MSKRKKPFHLGEQIELRLADTGMSKAEFGRRINTSRQNINTLINKNSTDCLRLVEISNALKYNFFEYCLEELLPELRSSAGRGQGTEKPSLSLVLNFGSAEELAEALPSLKPILEKLENES